MHTASVPLLILFLLSEKPSSTTSLHHLDDSYSFFKSQLISPLPGCSSWLPRSCDILFLCSLRSSTAQKKWLIAAFPLWYDCWFPSIYCISFLLDWKLHKIRDCLSVVFLFPSMYVPQCLACRRCSINMWKLSGVAI